MRMALQRLPLCQFEGQRARSNAQPHEYVLKWSPVLAPLQQCRCELLFQDQLQQLYRFQCPAHQLLDWLMQAVESSRQDLPDTFWKWLLLEQFGEDGSP